MGSQDVSGPGDHATPIGAPVLTGAVRRGLGRPAVEHGARLLGLLGATLVEDASSAGMRWSPGDPRRPGDVAGGEVLGSDSALDPGSDWAASGAMWLTGNRRGAPLSAPGAPASAARGAALALEALTSSHPRLRRVSVDGGRLLGERAAIAGLGRLGGTSPGGSCRLVTAADATLAVNLPRRSDLELVAAWLQVDPGDDPWATVVAACAERRAKDLVVRGQMIGLPVATVGDPAGGSDEQLLRRHSGFPVEPWVISLAAAGSRRAEVPEDRAGRPGRVVDLSSMWAGPLCANLLGLAGFEVVKVESPDRPDGARFGPAEFYDLLHAGHRSVTVDLRSAGAVARLLELMEAADVVIESSRPRALDELGLGPDALLERSPGVVFVSVTGYGRTGPWRNRVAFGDDAAVAAGLVAFTTEGSPVFCGDAIADPLTGLHAAVGALGMWCGGVGGLLDVPLREVTASVLGPDGLAPPSTPARHEHGDWVIETGDGRVPVARPSARQGVGRAARLGEHTAEVLAPLP